MIFLDFFMIFQKNNIYFVYVLCFFMIFLGAEPIFATHFGITARKKYTYFGIFDFSRWEDDFDILITIQVFPKKKRHKNYKKKFICKEMLFWIKKLQKNSKQFQKIKNK